MTVKDLSLLVGKIKAYFRQSLHLLLFFVCFYLNAENTFYDKMSGFELMCFLLHRIEAREVLIYDSPFKRRK